ncbi:N-acetylmuramoyl-L-alanine amidase, partial [Aduncisulcus paluster]
MLSAVIPSELSYPAMPLARQQEHHRDQTVSRRFKPSSRTTLIGEQPNPWDLLQPQDVMSRHRGAKPRRRSMALPCGTTGSLRPTFVPARHVCLTVKLPYAFALNGWFPISLREPLQAS